VPSLGRTGVIGVSPIYKIPPRMGGKGVDKTQSEIPIVIGKQNLSERGRKYGF
jgi:hypothetical protein